MQSERLQIAIEFPIEKTYTENVHLHPTRLGKDIHHAYTSSPG